MKRRSPLKEVKGFGGLDSPNRKNVGDNRQTKEQQTKDLSEAALDKIKKERGQDTPEVETPEPPAPKAIETPAEPQVNEPETQETDEDTLTTSKTVLEGMLNQAVDAGRNQGREEAIAEGEAAQNELTAENEQLRSRVAELEKKEEENDFLKSIFEKKGLNPVQGQAPAVNTHTSINGEAKGAVKEALDILWNSPAYGKKNAAGSSFVYADPVELNRFVKQHKKRLIQDLEGWGKSHGLFAGKHAQTYGELKSATTGGDIPGGFLEVLSAVMRTINRGSYIFWQFPTTVHRYQLGQGDLIDIPRAKFNKPPKTSNDRKLSGKDVYRKIDSGNQSIQTGIEKLLLEEFGLGANADFPPISIPTFVAAYSMLNLIDILDRNLYQDYLVTEDLLCREPLLTSDAIVYNNGDRVTSVAGDVQSGSGGQINPKFLNKLFGYMRELQIPTYSGGRYALVLPTGAASDFKNSLTDDWEAPSESSLRELTEILNPTLGGEMDRVTGYLGNYNNFMLFETNTYGTGAPDPDGINGVFNETLGVGNRVTRNCLAMGANATGRGMGSQFNIVKGDDTDFQRSNRYIWTSEEAHGALDVAPQAGDTRPVPQQLRVLNVRHLEEAA